MKLLRLGAIVGPLPVTLTNGTTADAVQVMSDLNWLVNEINANSADAALVALLAANNNFTVVQSGVAATAAAHFPIASQVQNVVFNTLSSTLGTNALTGRVAALPLAAYLVGQVFTFIPSQRNTGSVTYNIDALGSGVIRLDGQQLTGGELGSGTAIVRVASAGPMPVLDLLNPILSSPTETWLTNSLGADVALNNTNAYFDGPTVAQGTIGTWFVTGTVCLSDTGNSAFFNVRLWDGTTNIASARTKQGTVNGDIISVSLSGVIASPTGNLRISARDTSATSGSIVFNGSGLSLDSTITAIRIS